MSNLQTIAKSTFTEGWNSLISSFFVKSICINAKNHYINVDINIENNICTIEGLKIKEYIASVNSEKHWKICNIYFKDTYFNLLINIFEII